MTPISNATNNLELDRPLRIYRRERAVEAELAGLNGLSTRALIARVESSDSVTMSNEALVAVSRAFVRTGQADLATRVVTALARRITGRALRHLDVWGVHGREAREDLLQDMVRMMCECVYCLDTAQEFWECRFWTCFDRRARTLLRDEARSVGHATPLDDIAESLPAASNDAGIPVERKAQVTLALQQIPEPYRTAFYLRHYGGYSEESGDPDEVTVARILNVGGRTVRNYLRRAETYLSEWRDSDAEH